MVSASAKRPWCQVSEKKPRESPKRGGVSSLMGEVLEDHIRFHLTDPAKEQIAPELAEELLDMVRAYLK